MQKRSTLGLLWVSLLLGFSVITHAQDGTLDPTFGNNGIAVNPTSAAGVPLVLTQPDQKIIRIVGNQILRNNPDGSVDASFGSGGFVTIPSSIYFAPVDAVGLPDGKFVIAGTDAGGLAAIRFNQDGSLDASFGGDGKAITMIGSNAASAFALAVQPDGKVIVAGTVPQGAIRVVAVVRFNGDGSLDASFNGNGTAIITPPSVITSSPGTANDNAPSPKSVAVQLDGKIVVAFSFIESDHDTDIGVARLNADGSRDMGFGTNGLFTALTKQAYDYSVPLAIQPDGKILVAVNERWEEAIVHVLRLNPDGTRDGTFSAPYFYTANMNYYIKDVAVQQDGKVVVSGYTTCFGTYYYACTPTKNNDFIMARYLSNGLPDSSFRGGNYRLNLSDSYPESGGYLAPQGTKILVGGNMQQSIVFRLNNSSPLLPRNPILWYQDSDGDGFGSSSQTQVAYVAPAGYVSQGGDCNDGDATIHPGATEVADGKDNDCNGIVDDVITYTTIPAKIEAEAYSNQSGTQVENTTDAGGGQNVGYIDQGDWLDYNISVPSADTYTVNFRVASTMDGAQFQVYNQQGQLLTTVTVPNTGGWQNWTTVSATLALPQGNQSLRLYSSSAANWNINWIEFTQGSTPPVTYVTIPTKIEAEAYSAQNGTQVENTSDAGGGQNVGYIEQGDWMEYNISVPSAGSYTLNVRVASQMTGGTFEVRSSTGTVLTSFTVPNTGGWQNWTTLTSSVTLPADNQVLRLISASTANWNINWLEFVQGVTPPPGNYVTIPARIEAEAYSAQSGTKLEATTDVGGGQNVGYIDKGDWLEYQVHSNTAGSYTFVARVSSVVPVNQQGASLDTARFQVQNSTGQVLATLTVPNTGQWQNWTNVSAVVSLPAGDQTIRLVSIQSANWNVNWIEFADGGTTLPPPTVNYITIPARVEAESYFAQSGTLVEETTDTGGGQDVGYIDLNDNMTYAINVPAAGTYNLAVRVASAMAGGSFKVTTDRGVFLASFTVPNTGGWQNWVTITQPVTLSSGNLRLIVVSTSTANWNINWMDFGLSGAPARAAGTQDQSVTRITPVMGTLSVYPNPVRSTVTLQVNNDKTGVMLVDVVDLGGRVQKRFSVNKQSVSASTTLPLSGLPTGVYLLKVQMDGWMETRKIIKE